MINLHEVQNESMFSQVHLNTACHIHSSYPDYRFRMNNDRFEMRSNYHTSWELVGKAVVDSWSVRICGIHGVVNCPFSASLL